MSAFGSGPSNGQFWYGNTTNFPGFLYKKNVGVGGRRSTKMAPGGNITCNSATDLYNKYKPGTGGVGASSTANRRAKNRLATICGSSNKCFPCYNTLGQYSNYTHNPNGFVPCPGTINIISSSGSVTPTPTPTPSGGYILTYNAGGTGTVTGSPPAQPTSYSGGTGVPILGQGSFALANRTFSGWNTSISGGDGIYYPPTSTLIMPYADTILYAQWYNQSSTLFFTVTYDGNNNPGGGGTAPPGGAYVSGQGVPISANTGSLTNSSLTFNGWNTAANGLGTAYPVTSNGFTMPFANVTLYAQWVNTSTTYILTYFGNGSDSGTVPSPTPPYPSGASVSVSSPTIAKSGYTFIGWNTVEGGSGTNYSNNASIVMDSNKSLYAQWVSGVLTKSCPVGFNNQSIAMGSTSSNLYRDNTNNTMTTIIQVKYSTGDPPGTQGGPPYGTGNGPSDTTHTGNMLNTYSRVELSQVAGVYTFNILYKTTWTGQTETQTGTLPLGIPGSPLWPTGETIQDITIITTGMDSFQFSCLPTPTPPTPPPIINPPATFAPVSFFGCGSYSEGIPYYVTITQVISFYINFSNNTSTRVAIAIQNQWQGTANPFTLNYNRSRIELANGPTPGPGTFSGVTYPYGGTFTSTVTSSVNSSV
jgi:uncharacterized repeat protein (TIGR02543 family)